MKIDTVQARVAHLPRAPALTSLSEIDSYINALTQFIQQLINNTVPWAKPLLYEQPQWTTEVQEAVEEEYTL